MEKTKGNSRRDSMARAEEEISVDWRGRPCKPNKHGGMSAAIFILGLSLSLSLSSFSIISIMNYIYIYMYV